MQVYRDLTQPTTVSHCTSAAFVQADQKNLVVVRGRTLLQVYRFVSYERHVLRAGAGADGFAMPAAGDGGDGFIGDFEIETSVTNYSTKLSLVAQFELNGTVTGISRIRSPEAGQTDYVLLAFERAKLSLVRWDPAAAALATVSLHYYEKDALNATLAFTDQTSSAAFLRTDPADAHACLKFERNRIAFLPYRSDDDDVAGAASAPGSPLFHPSFVATPADLGDDGIVQITDLVFLHEYREPTLAILYESAQTWTSELETTKDNLTFLVLAFDFQQRASTSILKIPALPYDLTTLLALPAPIGGTLAIGANVLIHIDPSGKCLAVAVNAMAALTTAIELVDRAELNYRLEGSVAKHLFDRYVLLTLATGELVVLQFVMEGRSVEGLTLNPVAVAPDGGAPVAVTAACIEVWAASKTVFIGAEIGNSLLLSWQGDSKTTQNSLTFSATDLSEPKEVKFAVKSYDDDIDLYGDDDAGTAAAADAAPQTLADLFAFSIEDVVLNHGPIVSVNTGKPEFPAAEAHLSREVSSKFEIVAARGGQNGTGGLSIFRRSLSPTVVGQFSLPDCKALWTVKTKSRNTKSAQDPNVDQFDNFLIVSKADESYVFSIGDEFHEVRGTEFDANTPTLAVGTVLDGTRIVQICPGELRVYDSDFQIAQMIPVALDDDQAETTVVTAHFVNNSVLVTLDDHTAMLYLADPETYELVQAPWLRSDTKYMAGTLCTLPRALVAAAARGRARRSAKSNKRKRGAESAPPADEAGAEDCCMLLTADGTLQIYQIATAALCFECASASDLPAIVSVDGEAAPADGAVVEMLYVPLGDDVVREDYLVLRTDANDVVLYRPIVCPGPAESQTELRFVKVEIPQVTRAFKDPAPADAMDTDAVAPGRYQRLFPMADVSGFATVFVLGAPAAGAPDGGASWLVKTAKSLPTFVPFAGGATRALSPFHSEFVEHGFIYVDRKNTARICRISKEFDYSNTFLAKQVSFPDEIQNLTYFPPQSVYVAGTTREIPYEFENEDEEKQPEDDLKLPAPSDQGALQLISPISWITVDTFELLPNEIPLVVKTVNLEVSEQTKARRQLLAVGTGLFRGEDLPAKGFVYILDIIEVVPEPGKPEINHRFKLIAKEEVRGAVSSLCDINGYLLSAQGPKVMVRGLKEDDSFLPVAFMDMNIYVTEARSIKSTILLGDAMKSVWFVGFSEEPYKLELFGKDVQQAEVIAADFVIDGSNLHFVIVDSQKKIYILQYDPEDPRSLSGQKLIRKSEFYAGHAVQALTMVPKVAGLQAPRADDSAEADDQYLTLGGTLSGHVFAIVPISETAYRRLNIVQQQLYDRVESHAGLNPRMYRAHQTNAEFNGQALRAVLDGNNIYRYLGLPRSAQRDAVGKEPETEIWNQLVDIEQALAYM
ncbi:CPSF A subunit region-domain-containing protein [Dipodascopsis tothii]|uniref:CPSF A subunit region-domain-containing protein n=1 Tax=Dipodascopsis tothii TaxID=44089 RepID=UPI0034CDA887